MADSEESRQKQHLQILSAMAEQAHYNHLKQFHSLLQSTMQRILIF